jgi:hypothetical protein
MMNYNPDPYSGGAPKWQSSDDIYEGLEEILRAEEIGIINELLRNSQDVSWENQDYEYIARALALKERWDKLSEYGEKDYLFSYAATQMDDGEIHDVVADCLRDPDIAKRFGFKKIFVETQLRGDGSRYAEIRDDIYERVHDLDRYDGWNFQRVFYDALKGCGFGTPGVFSYDALANAVAAKFRKLPLGEYRELVAECRATLMSYDDFMFGLRANQALYDEQTRCFEGRLAALDAEYKKKEQFLLAAAERLGLGEKLAALIGQEQAPALPTADEFERTEKP